MDYAGEKPHGEKLDLSPSRAIEGSLWMGGALIISSGALEASMTGLGVRSGRFSSFHRSDQIHWGLVDKHKDVIEVCLMPIGKTSFSHSAWSGVVIGKGRNE